MLKKALIWCVVLAVCAVFTSCSENAEPQSGTGAAEPGAGAGTVLAKVKKAGKMIVYSNPEFPPYEYLGEGGVIAGAEIDIVNRIAEKIGVKAEIVSAEFDSILMTVATGKADMGASGFTINEERKKKVSFSKPFVVSVQYLIVPKDSPVKTVEDLAGKKIGGQNGTTGFMMCEDAVNKGVLKGTGAEMKSFNTAPDAVVAMNAGKIDAVVIDDLVAKALAGKNADTTKTFPMVTKDGKGLDAPEEFGLMLAQGNDDFIQICNEVIDEMQKDGSLEAAFAKHRAITEGPAAEKK